MRQRDKGEGYSGDHPTRRDHGLNHIQHPDLKREGGREWERVEWEDKGSRQIDVMRIIIG